MTVAQIIRDDSENGDLILNFGLMKNLSEFGAVSAYSGICGGGYEAAFVWADHNVYEITEVENEKYMGWIIKDSDGREHKVYIAKWVLDIRTTNWEFALNLFCKYLTVKRNN